MTPIILKRGPDPNDPLLAWVDATVGMTLLAMAWLSAGWLGYVLLDRHATGQTRLIVLGVTAIYQVAAFTLAARARNARR